MLLCLCCHLPRTTQDTDGAGGLEERASFSSLREGARGGAEPALEAPPDLPLEQLLDPSAAEWGAALAAAARGAAGSTPNPSAAREPGGGPPASALESGMLYMSAFGMGEALEEPGSALESGMLDMGAFGMGGAEPQAQPAPGGGLDSGQLDMSAFGMGGWDSGGGDGGGAQAGAQESGMLDMGAFGMGGWDDEQQGASAAPGGQGPQPSGAPGQALVLRKRPPERFAALPDGELEELRGLLGVPGGPARRRGRWDDAGDENGAEPRCCYWVLPMILQVLDLHNSNFFRQCARSQMWQMWSQP